MHVSGLRIYPVKSTAGIDVAEAYVHPWGLEHDRRWMVVDAAGETVTARSQRRLLHVRPRLLPDGGIQLCAPDRAPLVVPEPTPTADAEVPVGLSRLDSAVAAGDDADRWFSALLGEDVRLVWLDDPGRRTVGVDHGGAPGDPLNLSDAGPLLLTTTASLARLNEWLVATARDRGEPVPEPLPMVRFRPSVVIDGAEEAFAEDDWKRLRIGAVELRFGEHCDRCVVTTIDPASLATSKEPIRTLALHRHWESDVFFGIRCIPLNEGVVRVGDPVEIR